MVRVRSRYLSSLVILFVAAGLAGPARAQSDKPATPSQPPAGTQSAPVAATDPQAQPADDADPLKRRPNDKQKKAQKRALNIELSKTYKKWLNEDVVWIITDQERAAFKQLSNDEERDNFIEAFWQRRDPTPDTEENEYKEEHYRRIAYANEHFAAGIPGWKTDRGRIYIMYGPADEIDSHPSGGSYERPIEEGGGETSTFPFEDWRYRYLEGIGQEVIIEFVDTCMCGDYHFTIDRGEKDALSHVPGMGLTQWEQMGMAKKADRFAGSGLETLGSGPMRSSTASKEFDRLELEAKIFAPPPVKFTDLDAFITEHKILTGPALPFDVRTDFVKVTDGTILVPVTIQLRNRDITFKTVNGVSTGEVNILGKVTTITHKTVQTFEETVQVEQPAELLQSTLDYKKIYWKALPLSPGLYRLDIAIKDVNNPDHIGIYGRALSVPEYQDEKLGTSSLILADSISPVSTHDIGEGNCVIGNTKICPRVTAGPAFPVTYKRNQDLAFWMQVYNLGIDEASKSNSATVTYEIVDTATNDVILSKEIDSKDLGSHSDQLTVDKTLPLAGLQPGKYKVTIKVNDEISKQMIAQSAPFVVE